MTTSVVDASVAAKWFLPSSTEAFASEAANLYARWHRNEIQFAVPDHFWAELGAVLWKAERQGRITRDIAQSAIAELTQQGLRAVSTAILVKEALRLAFDNQRTVYDTLYVALALNLPAELVTADERLVNALGARFPVRWLGAF